MVRSEGEGWQWWRMHGEMLQTVPVSTLQGGAFCPRSLKTLVQFILGVLAAMMKCNYCVGHGQLVLEETATVESNLSILSSCLGGGT